MTTNTPTQTPSASFARRHRKGLTITGIALAGVLVAGVGSYGVLRATPAEFPLVYSETIAEGTDQAVAIADASTALTFARVDTGTGPTVLAVTGYDNGTITGVDINQSAGTAFTEPIEAFNTLGYAALQQITDNTALPPITVDATSVLTALDTHSHHIGTGTNYVEHQEESTIHEPFLFPKIATPTPANGTLPVGTGLLDYEVELGIVPLTDITAETGVPEHMGLILSNDWTDRELLTQQIEPDNLTGGAGFTNAKSQPGYLSTGDLFVIPADWETYYKDLELDLFVNGDLRQRAHPTDMVWDANEMIQKSLEASNRTWDSDGEQTTLTPTPGTITAGTIIQSGTPEGVVYRAPDTRQKVLGFMEYAGSFTTNADSIVDSALKVYVRDSHDAGVYLQEGDQIITRAEGLGQIHTTIVPGQQSQTE